MRARLVVVAWLVAATVSGGRRRLHWASVEFVLLPGEKGMAKPLLGLVEIAALAEM
jgi:hypothetical protein